MIQTHSSGTTTYVQLNRHFAIPRVHSGAVVTVRNIEMQSIRDG
jgi:hypothetical protein